MPPPTASFAGCTAGLCLTLSLTGLARAQTWEPLPPLTDRAQHALAYDSLRGRVVLFGGVDGGAQLRSDTWEFDGVTWHSVTTPTSPSPRYSHAMAFDSQRGKVVLFGGNNPTLNGETWEYDGVTWTQVAASGPTPVARSGHAMSYDPARGVVLFGGGAGVYLADTWQFDGTSWTQQPTSSAPSARARHAMAYDSARAVHVLFGGTGLNGQSSETWELDGNGWSQVPVAGPIARYSHGMAFHAASGKVVVFGGTRAGQAYMNDTWEYDGTSWALATPASTPPGRQEAPLAPGGANGSLVLCGGQVATGRAHDTWQYDGTSWTQVPDANAPPGRMGSCLAYDALHGEAVMFGGIGRTSSTPWTILADMWKYDGAAWSAVPLTPSSPPVRAWHGLTYDAARGCIVLYGGGDNSSGSWVSLHDTWEYDGASWSQVVTTNAPTGALVYTMAYDMRRRRHVVFGGLAVVPGSCNDETWEYDGVNWMQKNTTTTPTALYGQGMTFDARRNEVVMFGGFDNAGLPSNDTWLYDGTDWLLASPSVSPPGRFLAGAITFDPARGRTVIFGGGLGNNSFSDETWAYDGVTWQVIPIAVPPAALISSSMGYDSARDRMLRFGGQTNGAQTPSQSFEFTPAPGAWWTGYGAGCAGSGGTPALGATSLPSLGGSLDLTLANLPPTAGVLLVATGFDLGEFGGQPLPLDLAAYGLPGCSLWIGVESALSSLQPHPGSTATITIPIPNIPAFAGVRFGTQVLVLDPAAANGIGAVSNAGIAVVD